MTASTSTVQTVLKVLRRYHDKTTLREILLELRSIPGNRSFVETIRLLYQLNDATP